MIRLKVKGITVSPYFIIFVIVFFLFFDFSFFASSFGVPQPPTEQLVRRSGRKTCEPAAVSGRLFQRFSGQALHTAVLSVTDLCVSTLRIPSSSASPYACPLLVCHRALFWGETRVIVYSQSV